MELFSKLSWQKPFSWAGFVLAVGRNAPVLDKGRRSHRIGRSTVSFDHDADVLFIVDQI